MRNIIRYGIKNRSLGYTLRTAAHILKVAVHPSLDVETLDPVDRRYRPGGLLANVGLVLLAFGWNLLYLSQTIRQRHRDRQRIKRGDNSCVSC